MEFNKLLLWLCFISLPLSAQFGRNEIYKSKTVKNEITLSVVDKDHLDYFADLDITTEKTLKDTDYFQVKSKEFRVYADFVNPFEYIYKSSEKTLDDELFTASQEFVQSAVGYIGGIQKINEKAMFNVPKNDKLEPELVEMYLLVTSIDSSFFSTNSAFKRAMIQLNYMEVNKNIFENYTNAFTELKELTIISNIKKVVASNKDSLANNKSILENLKRRFIDLKKESQELKFAEDQLYLKTYIATTIATFETKVKSLESLKTAIDSKYDKITVLFNEIYERKHKLGANKFLLSKVTDVKMSKRHELTVVLEKIAFNDTDKSIKIENTKSFLLHVRKKTTFIPVFSSGVLYTNLSFPQYSTDTNAAGETIVTQTKDKENEIAVAAYLNLYFNNDWDIPVFLQFGIGPSKEKPLFFLGGGFELLQKLTFSTGAVFTWMPKLNDLAIGDKVGGASIVQKDISFEFDRNPKIYFGISFDITNK